MQQVTKNIETRKTFAFLHKFPSDDCQYMGVITCTEVSWYFSMYFCAVRLVWKNLRDQQVASQIAIVILSGHVIVFFLGATEPISRELSIRSN